MKHYLFFISVIISLILVFIIFRGIDFGYFLFLHDELLILSKFDSSGSFFTNNLTDLGTANTTILLVTIFDRLYYFITLFFHMDVLLSEKILYGIKIFLSIWVPFLGFKKLFSLFLEKPVKDLTVYVIALWYAFNTYTIIYWHGNSFSLTIMSCYILAPLAFYYFHKVILMSKVRFIDRLIFLVLVFFMSFALYLFPVFLLIVLIYFVFYLIFNFSLLLTILKNIIITITLSIPLMAIHFIILYDIYTSGTNALNTSGGETYGNLQGGLLYPMLMWFSWGIYTIWEPRNIFTFHSYFKTIPAILAPFSLYFLIVFDFFKGKKLYYKWILAICLLLLLFLIKGPQGPFGEIYTFLINHVSVFRVFRSPDNKLGFGIIFIIACLLLIASQSINKKIFIVVIASVVFIQGYLFFSGVATKGENTETSLDRVIAIGSEYKEYLNFINSKEGGFGYISTIPPVTFANYNLGQGESHWGQDLLPKFSKYPYIYIDNYGGMNIDTYEKISFAIKGGDSKDLNGFPIRFYVLRTDVQNYSLEKYQSIISNLENNFANVFENKFFTVYENEKYVPIIYGDDVQYTIVSPVEYKVLLKNISNISQVHLLQNYNKNWNLYLDSTGLENNCKNPVEYTNLKVKECQLENFTFNWKNILYSFQKSVFPNEKLNNNSYYNTWLISKSNIEKKWGDKYYTVNSDGTINVSFTIYFKTQAVLYLLTLILVLYCILILSLILILTRKNRLKND